MKSSIVSYYPEKRWYFLQWWIVVCALSCIVHSSFAQLLKPNVSIPSPNAAGLGMYGEIPVSLYSGLPTVEIPLYTVEEGKIKVPISLSYHASGVRVNQHPGWVGLNWTLNAGGSITRILHGGVDEGPNDRGYYSRSNSLNKEDWNTLAGVTSTLQEKLDAPLPVYFDTEPDEFTFNFLGYSGKFYRSHLGAWKVVSDQSFRVEDTGLLNTPSNMNAGLDAWPTFGGFVITTDDGMKFYFGGSTSAIEYSTDFNFQLRDRWIADTWQLTKIETPEGNSVTFSYGTQTQNKYVASFYTAYQASNISIQMEAGSVSGYSQDPRLRYSGTLHRPVYLSKITFSKGFIDFGRLNTNELKYPNRVLEGFAEFIDGDGATGVYASLRWLSDALVHLTGSNSGMPSQVIDQVPYMLDRLVWQKLDNISVRQDNGQEIKFIKLGYNDSSEHRLMLTKLSIESNGCKENYGLDYYNEGALPGYFDEYDQTDHWGFFNANTDFKYADINDPINQSNYFNHKQPSTNINVLNAGSLKKIFYPTGGSTEFVYEPHTIYKYKTVNNDGSFSLSDHNNQKVGGLRIKNIVNNDGIQTSTKSYSYEWNSGSSGIGNGLHEYRRTTSKKFYKKNGDMLGSIARSIFSVSNTLPMSENSLGSHIGYRQVKESNQDGSYSIYSYTNYISDDGSHMDDFVPESEKFGSEGNIYDPQISKALERGKLLKVEHYSSLGLVKKQVNTYKRLSNDIIRAVKAYGYDFKAGNQVYLDYVGIPYGFHAYQYKLEKEEHFQYDEDNSGRSTHLIKGYTYNSLGLESEVSHTVGNKISRTLTKYVSDYVNSNAGGAEAALSIFSMQFLGMNGKIIEQQVWNNDTGTDAMVSGYLNFFRRYDAKPGYNNIQVERTYKFLSAVPVSDVELSYTYGPNFNFDSRYSNIVVDFGNLNSDGYTKDGNPAKFKGKDAVVNEYEWYEGDKFGLLKSQKVGSQETTYEYEKPLVGVSKITGPTGDFLSYGYDGFNRLETIRDYKDNLVESFTYSLAGNAGCTNPSLVRADRDDDTQTGPYKRIVIIGNSITKLIAQAEGDGWRSDNLIAEGGWGRASSTKDKDFAHILEQRFKELDADAKVLPLWEAPFERDYTINSLAGWPTYDYAVLQNKIQAGLGGPQEKPDLIIIRLGENVVNSQVELHDFKTAVQTLISKVKEISAPGAKVIVTNSMWPDQPAADARLQEVATLAGYPFVNLSDLLSNPIYHAGHDPATLAAFPNNKGDLHPGDAGMLEIADRIWAKVRNVELPSNIGGNITNVRLYPNTNAASLAGSMIQGSNDSSNPNGWTTLTTINDTPNSGWKDYPIRTTTAWRYMRFVAGPNSGGGLEELEFYNGSIKLNGSWFGSSGALNNNPDNYGYLIAFDGQVDGKYWQGTTPGSQNFAGIDLGAGCSSFTASVLAPVNNATVDGTASTVTAGRVTTEISVNVCAPIGSIISSVEIWAATSTGGWPNRMGYAVAVPGQPGIYRLSAIEGSANGQWPTAYLDPGTYRFYAVVNTGSGPIETPYVTVTLAAPAGTGSCPTLSGNILSPVNNASVVGTASTTTAGRVTTAISVNACAPTGFTVTSVEVWAATSTGGFPNRMGYAKADPTQPGVYKLSADEGNANGQWPTAFLDPGTYRFYAKVKAGTAEYETDYITLTLTAPVGTGNCPTLSGNIVSPANNASVVGTASNVTAGRVTAAISVNACAPTGFTISSVEIWAATSTGGWPNRMGYAEAVPGQPGIYTLSAVEGNSDGQWPTAFLDPGTYRFYAKVKAGAVEYETDYIMLTLTAPAGTPGCPTLSGNILSPANNASVVGTASTTTAGRVTTAISVNACAPAGFTVTSVEVWAATSTGGFPNRMGYAVEFPGQPGVYRLSHTEGASAGQWPTAYLDPGTYRFYAKVKSGTAEYETDYIMLTLTAPTGAGSCPTLNGSILSPANNASVVGKESATTPGRVTTAISVNACAPTGLTVTSVEVWAATSTGGFPNRMGYAAAVAGQPGVYTLSPHEGNSIGQWPTAYLDPGTYRFYAKVKAGTVEYETDYIMLTLTAPSGMVNCPSLTGEVVSPSNNSTVVGTASAITAGRVTTSISVNACAPAGSVISSVEIWAATSSGGFPNRMGYAVADPGQPGVFRLSAEEGTGIGQWPTAYLDPGTYRFYAKVYTSTGSVETGYITITLTSPNGTVSCPSLTGSVLSPSNNATVVGKASANTPGRVTTAINISACAPAGSVISSVEVWAATSTGGWPNRVGYALAMPGQPGVFRLSAEEGTGIGQWPVAYLDPGTYRFYAKLNTSTGSVETGYITVTLTHP
jgi:hypothetical protein